MFDRWFLVIATLLGLVLWFEGYHAAADVEAQGEPGATRAILGVQGAEGGTLSLTLPAGLRIDPATGLLLGVVPPDIPGVEPVMWELLRTYEYRPGLEGMPEDIKKLDGKKVVMIGFLMTVFEYDDIHEFHLVASHWSCCYGVPPGLDGAVSIKLKEGEEGLPNTIKPLRVIGTLRVAEVKESDIVYAIYSIDEAEARIMDY
ncbi:MAG: DUF3299 domain-containing protein [Planctomycetota bacterium]|nr:DUF3299 domain-containing protein [Planctomycetota bacterium]